MLSMFKNIRTSSSKGFTLIELLVVITIIGLLATVGLTSYRSLNRRARDGRRQSDVQELRSALEAYRTDEGAYPAVTTIGDLETALTATPTYINPFPEDPQTSTHDYTYSGTATGYTITYWSEVLSADQTVTNPL